MATIAIEIPVSLMDQTEPALSGITKKLSGLEKSAFSMSQGLQKSGTGTSKFLQSFNKAHSSLRSFSGSKFSAIMEVKDKASGIIKTVTAGVKNFAGKAWGGVLKVTDLATKPIRNILGMLKSPLLAAGLTLSVGGAVASSVKTYAGFESTMSEVKAIAQPTNEEFDKLTQKAMGLGATTKFTAQESAEAMKYMGMAGWKAGDMMGGIGGILNLAAASGEDLGRTSDIVTDSLTAFNMKASDAAHFSDVLAQAATNSNTNVSTMGETFKYAATMAGTLGYSIEDVGIATGLMANAGIKGTMAGTALNGLFTRLAVNTNGARDAVQELGVQFYNADGSAKKFSEVMVGLRKATAGMTTEQKANIANTIAGERAQKGLLAILNASETDYNKLTESMNNADGAAARMSDIMLDNLSGRFTRFTSAIDGLKVSFGKRLSPYLGDILEWATDSMPQIEKTLMNGMNAFDEFFENTKEKIKSFTGSADWQNADLFGKIGIAWDQLIAEPFGEWWNGSGKQFFADKAKDIGKGIGTGISTGILALLGIDVSGVIDDGASIGRSFAKGFSEGFDVSALNGSFMGAIGGLFSSASAVLPGGKKADLSNWLSALIIGKVGSKALGGTGSLIGGLTGASLPNVAAWILGSTGNQMVQGTGLLNLLANAGYGMTGGSVSAGGYFGAGTAMSGGAAAALGTAGIAGGLIGAGTLISSYMDTKRAIQASDAEGERAYRTSAGIKAGGVVAGATAGAAIGAGFFGIGAIPGALIGAGIGGLAGIFGGNKATENYEESKKKAEEAAYAAELMGEKSKYALEGATFSNKNLKEAFKDTGVTATAFGEMMREASSEKIRDSFGKISLSLNEIQEAAKQILFADSGKQMTQYSNAAEEAARSVTSLQKATSNMAKLNWKAGLEMVNDQDSIAEYKTGITNMLSETQNVLENEHYQATASVELLVGEDESKGITAGIDNMYKGLQDELNSASKELHTQLNIALEDGKITADEQKILAEYQDKVTSITEKITNAEAESKMQAIQIKYSGSELSADSFVALTTELQAQGQEAADSYQSALEAGLTNLNLQKQGGLISGTDYEKQYDALVKGYQSKIQSLGDNVKGFQLDSIANAFGSELDNIMPGMEGTVQEKLNAGLSNAMAAGVDVSGWTDASVGDASKWFNFEGMEASTASALTQMLGTVASSLPQTMDSSQVTEAVEQNYTEGIQNASPDMGSFDPKPITDPFWNRLGESLASGQIETSAATSGMESALQSIGEEASNTQVDMAPVGQNVSNSTSESIASADFSGATAALGSGLGAAILATFPQAQSAISSLYSQVASAINSAFSAGFSTSTTVTITANYRLANPTATINFSGGGSGSATVHGSVSSHAEGGFSSGPELGIWGEDGPEVIIPLSGKRRRRGLDLWKKAGKMMGVSAYADGGFVGDNYSSNVPDPIPDTIPTYVGGYSGGGNSEKSEDTSGGIQISINMNNSFDVGGGGASEEGVVATIRSKMKEIADELAAELAGQLSDAYENTPA